MPRNTRRRPAKPPSPRRQAKAPGASKGGQAKAPTAPAKAPTPRADRRADGSQYFLGDYTPFPNIVDDLHSRFRGAFMWSAYGDACGMPFETKAPLEIFDRNGGWVTGLTHPKNSFGAYLKSGGWTDDTQLKLAIMEAVLNEGEVNMPAIAQGHVRIWDVGARGWGGSTRESVLKLKKGVPWQRSGKRGGAGNGIPMKVGVIGALYGIAYSTELKAGEWRTDSRNLYRDLAVDVRNIAVMTHMDSRAIVSGIVHAVLVAWAMNDIDPLEKWDDLMRMVDRLESIFPTTDVPLSSRLKFIEPNIDRDVEYFAHLFRTGCFVVESYPFSVATYLLYRDKVMEGVLAAVNCGGDCDSTASMVGELCGAEAGLNPDPNCPTLGLEEHDLLLGAADAYYDYCRNSHV